MKISRVQINGWLLITIGVSLMFYLGLWASGFQVGRILGAKDSISVEHVASSPVMYAQPIPVSVPALRPAYPFSLVAGGVSGIADFRNQAILDHVLTKWLTGFNWDDARIDEVCGPRYVTFRKLNRIKWTTKRVNIGCEKVITDGRRAFLLRCANEVSFVPQKPSESIDPAVLETPIAEPVAPPMRLVSNDMNDTFQSFPPSVPTDDNPPANPPVFLFPPSGGCCFVPQPPPGTVATPEPAAIFLILSGVTAIYLVTMALPRRHR